MSLLKRFPHRVSILRQSHVREAGEIASRPVEEVVATDVHAWVQNASMREVVEWQKREQNVTHRVAFSQGKPDLVEGDYIRVDSGPAFVGDRYKFIALSERSAGLGKLWSSINEVER